MEGFYVKTPCLSKEDAALAVQMLNTVSMRLDQAPAGLRVIGALMRIANDVDQVTQKPGSENRLTAS